MASRANETAATCGVMVTPGVVHSGLLAGRGSVTNTSRYLQDMPAGLHARVRDKEEANSMVADTRSWEYEKWSDHAENSTGT